MKCHVTRIRRHVLFGVVCLGFAAGCVEDGSTDRGELGEVASSIATGATRTFATGALIIPLDTHADDADELPGYGLVYELVRNNVPVQWAIRTGKTAAGSDIEIAAPAAVHDVRTGAAVGMPAAYRGGPFVIDASDRRAAMPIIEVWQAAHPVTVVQASSAGSFTATAEAFVSLSTFWPKAAWREASSAFRARSLAWSASASRAPARTKSR